VTPYADSLYFSLLLYLAVILAILGLTGRLSWRWVIGINAAMVAAQFSFPIGLEPETSVKIAAVAAFGITQWVVAAAYLRLRRGNWPLASFRLALALALVPMVLVKAWPMSHAGSLVAFVGLSYVSFRALDVIICIRDGLITALPFGRYVTYVLFFPPFSSGPIDRFNRFNADLSRRRGRAEWLQDLDGAIQHIFRGLLYKFILAALINQYWLMPSARGTSIVRIVSYMYAYPLYLFFDFAGYSAFAIAVSYLFGIRTPENFNKPFLATNIVDYWNRWHITLSAWFRDHVYMRYMLAAMRGRWFKSRVTAACVGFYISFGLMGLWHGFAARYLIYGLYHGTLLSAHTILEARRPKGIVAARPMWRNVLAMVVTFHLVCFGLLIFSGRLF
jgi:membrane protein involved in D-alanine export